MARQGRDQPKTNAVRILEHLGIAHRLVAYEVDEDDLSATAAAAKIGLPAERVFKTLALRGASGGVFFACVPGDAEIDLKKAARVAGEKSVELLSLKDLTPTTGYLRGGCSPLGAKRKFPVYVDETAQLFEEISVSAGLRGLQVLLAPDDLVRAASEQPGGVARASYADLV